MDPRGFLNADAEATIARERFLPGTDVRSVRKAKSASAALDEARGSPVGGRREAEAALAESALEASAYIEGAVKVFVRAHRGRPSKCERMRYFFQVIESSRKSRKADFFSAGHPDSLSPLSNDDEARADGHT